MHLRFTLPLPLPLTSSLQVLSLKSELVTADTATLVAKEKAAFLMRQLERVKAGQTTAVPAPTAKQQAVVTAASDVAVTSSVEAAMVALKQRVAQLEARDAAAKNVLKLAEQRLVRLSAELAASQKKEAKTASALTSTRSEMKVMQERLSALQVQLREGVPANADLATGQLSVVEAGSALLAAAGAAASKSAGQLAKLVDEVASAMDLMPRR